MWWLVCFLVGLPVVGLAWEAAASALDRRRFPPPGPLVDIGGPGSLGDTPLVVLSSARCELQPGNGLSKAEVEVHWQLMKQSQADLVQLSSRGKLITLAEVGHGVPQERPEAIVAAIRELHSNYFVNIDY